MSNARGAQNLNRPAGGVVRPRHGEAALGRPGPPGREPGRHPRPADLRRGLVEVAISPAVDQYPEVTTVDPTPDNSPNRTSGWSCWSCSSSRWSPAAGSAGSWATATAASDAAQTDREAVMSQAEQFVLRLNTYGPDQLDDQGHLTEYRDQVKEVITPKFAADFETSACRSRRRPCEDRRLRPHRQDLRRRRRVHRRDLRHRDRRRGTHRQLPRPQEPGRHAASGSRRPPPCSGGRSPWSRSTGKARRRLHARSPGRTPREPTRAGTTSWTSRRPPPTPRSGPRGAPPSPTSTRPTAASPSPTRLPGCCSTRKRARRTTPSSRAHRQRCARPGPAGRHDHRSSAGRRLGRPAGCSSGWACSRWSWPVPRPPSAPRPSTGRTRTSTDAARAAAERAVVPILSYDATHLDESKAAAEPYLTSDYRKEYDKLFDGIIAENAPATGTVEGRPGCVRASSAPGTTGSRCSCWSTRLGRTRSLTPEVYKNWVTVTMEKSSTATGWSPRWRPEPAGPAVAGLARSHLTTECRPRTSGPATERRTGRGGAKHTAR